VFSTWSYLGLYNKDQHEYLKPHSETNYFKYVAVMSIGWCMSVLIFLFIVALCKDSEDVISYFTTRLMYGVINCENKCCKVLLNLIHWTDLPNHHVIPASKYSQPLYYLSDFQHKYKSSYRKVPIKCILKVVITTLCWFEVTKKNIVTWLWL
jgi:hypothetical protein